MTPTPEQIRMAAINIRQPRTLGAKVRDALLHVRQSRNEKTGWWAGSHESSGQMNITEVIR